MEKRKSQEIEHNKKILEEKTDNVWGWNTFAGKLRLERRAILINEHIDRYANKNKNGLKALEIGCGTGLLTERLLSLSGVRTTSFDIYDGFVLKAKKRVEDIGEIAD
ncbi:MAG: class I SAM-dependent methyltransferase, partial [Candidatus Omnitrophica bacterium]|nr:class I SAM-dependent methyltransferase [Candidatus Omnitrophota bacterium]